MRSTQYKSVALLVSRQRFTNLIYNCTGRALFSAVADKSNMRPGKFLWGLDAELDKEVFGAVNNDN